jgi:hypothetical protein
MMKRSSVLILWTLAASIPASPTCAQAFEQRVLQKGIYVADADSRDNEANCAEARKQCPEVAKRFAGDSFWGEYFAGVCLESNKSKCVCSADVVYPALVAKDGSPAVNAALKKIAEGYACTAETAITRLRYDVTFNLGEIVSVVFDGYGRATGGQGSCHSQVLSLTANWKTGQVYKLADVLNAKEGQAITDSMVSYVMTYFGSRASKDDARRLEVSVRQSLKERLWNLGFYLKDRLLYVDLDDYILSCAEGPSFPVPIPSRFINNNDILGALRLQ